MNLTNLKPRPGATHRIKRVGCGESSGHGKTSGKGHKGQKARSGGSIRLGFEGGQMPLQRRLPKRGFKSLASPYKAEVRLSDLEKLPVGEVDILALKQAGVVGVLARVIRVIESGTLTKKVSLKGLIVTKGAKAAIEAAGGSIA